MNKIKAAIPYRPGNLGMTAQNNTFIQNVTFLPVILKRCRR